MKTGNAEGMNYESLREMARRAASPPEIWGLDLQHNNGYTTLLSWLQFYAGTGAQLMSRDATKVTVLNTEAELTSRWLYDLIHSHYWMSGQVGWLARERWGVPHVHTPHTLAKVKNRLIAAGDRPEPKARVIGEEQVVAESDRLVANTRFEAQDLVTWYDADPTQTDYITQTDAGNLAAAAAQDWAGKAEWDKTVAAAKKEGRVTISGPVGNGWREALTSFTKDYGIKVEFTAAHGADFWPRYEQEQKLGKSLWDLRISAPDLNSYALLARGDRIADVRAMLVLPEVIGDEAWYGGYDAIYSDKAKKYFLGFGLVGGAMRRRTRVAFA